MGEKDQSDRSSGGERERERERERKKRHAEKRESYLAPDREDSS